VKGKAYLNLRKQTLEPLNRNSERIPAEGLANKYGGRTCGGVSEQIKNRLYSLRSKIPRPLCGGELQSSNPGPLSPN